ncbi:RagB/SusD family nutrient uptake outer membrane protein [Bacteroidales bacterium OttesenSCG-928-I14]|nr:RagB/SusD family nutrient uptake outer membrane protein [Bacteroidales bacterium OttesenSCG-928-I14]
MRNKLFFFSFLLCSLLLGGISCSDKGFLDETVTTDLDREAIFADSTYTAGFLTGIYKDIGFDTDLDRFSASGNNAGGLQTACDEAEYKRSANITTDVMFATGTVNPIIISKDVWEKCYANIRKVNVFLKYVDGSPMAERAKNQYKAEARFLRAWYYAILLRHYGGIPLIGDNIYDPDDNMKTSRNTYKECVDFIVGECDEIVKLNVLSNRRTGTDYGRISSAACRALKSRVLLYGASDFFNGIEDQYAPGDMKEILGYPTYDKNRWKDAYDAALDIIALQEYRLFEWHKTGDANSSDTKPDPGWGFYAAVCMASDFPNLTLGENGITYRQGAFSGTILEKTADKGQGRERSIGPPTTGGQGYAGYIYKDLADCFPMVDGKPINGTDEYKSIHTYDPLNPANNRDPRFKNSVVYDGAKVCSSSGEKENYVKLYKGLGSTLDAVGVGTPTGLYTYKTHSRATAGGYFVGVPQSRPLMRYAEVLLNYAEAANEFYGPNHSDTYTSIYDVLKAIRSRAGIVAGDDGMYGLKANMNQDEMREAIRLERRIELAFEGHRFFDVRRWKIAETTENKMMHGLEITLNEDGTKTAREFNVRQHIFRPAMYFWPIPYEETSKSLDLKQNPGYTVDL